MRSLKSRQIIGFLVLLLLGWTSYQGVSQAQTHESTRDKQPIDVGMVALVASPERYEGKSIRTHGFLCIEFEGDAVYLHKEDYRFGLSKNSLALRLSKAQREQFKSLSLKYVVIEGTMYAKGLEATDAWSGAIDKITRLEVWPIDREPVPHQLR